MMVYSLAACFPAMAYAADLVVEVVDNTGAPIADAAVNVSGKGFARQNSTDEAGYASLRKVPHTMLTVSVEYQGLASGDAVVDMRAGESREVKITLTRMIGLEELLELPAP